MIATCFCRLAFIFAAYGQNLQAKGFSSVWSLTCLLICAEHFITILQIGQAHFWAAILTGKFWNQRKSNEKFKVQKYFTQSFICQCSRFSFSKPRLVKFWMFWFNMPMYARFPFSSIWTEFTWKRSLSSMCFDMSFDISRTTHNFWTNGTGPFLGLNPNR